MKKSENNSNYFTKSRISHYKINTKKVVPAWPLLYGGMCVCTYFQSFFFLLPFSFFFKGPGEVEAA